MVDYLQYAAQLRGIEARSAVRRAVEATELESKALDPIATLSRGFKQRVGVAQAILHEPRFLILDEPTNGLDPSQTEHMRALIKRLAETATVILSTHIMQEVDALCDRAIILRGGRLVLDERLAELKDSNLYRVRTAPGTKLDGLLGGLPCVAEALAEGEGTWRLRVTGELDAAARDVAAAVVGAGEPLYGLELVRQSLETVFREVNEAPLEGTGSAEVNHAA